MRRTTLIALLTVSVALCAVGAAIPLASRTVVDPGESSAIVAVTLAALLGVGLFTWSRTPTRRFGQVLFATGICWFFASLSNSDSELLYSLGRIFGWLFELMLVYTLLAFPGGRIGDRPGRVIWIASVALVVLAFLPTVPFVEQFPLPTPFAACGQKCPANFFFTGSEPSVIDSLVKPFRETVNLAIYISVAVLLATRLGGAGRNLRRTGLPVLGAAVVRFLAAGAYVAVRRIDAGGEVAEQATSLVAMLSISGIAFGFLISALMWRIFAGDTLLRLSEGVGEVTSPGELRSLLADCLDDPEVGLYVSGPGDGTGGEWRDSAGAAGDRPAANAERMLVEHRQRDGSRLVLRCDRWLGSFPRFLEAVCALAAEGTERLRLDRELESSIEEVAASRKRLVGASDSARRKIERDLHDGAQQQLVALRVKLELARDALARDPAPGAEMLARLGPEVDDILEEIRAIAHGIYPPLLASSGLAEALRSAGLRSALPVRVEADEIGRLSPEAESAIYFCCLEAMQNSAKHAGSGATLKLRLWRDDAVRFEVTDDGSGFTEEAQDAGLGITGMRDRLEALGGELTVESHPGEGTRLAGSLPAPAAGSPT